MPVAIIVFSDGTIPAVLAEDDAPSLLARLRALPSVPPLGSEDAARIWLDTLAPPSGWFEGVTEARAHLDHIRNVPPMTGKELAAIRAELGQSRAEFGSALGYAGNDNTRHKQVWEMEQGLKKITPAKALMARALAAGRRLPGALPDTSTSA